MADDILTRNEAGELAVRTTQTTGDTGTNKDDVYTRDSQGRLAVRTTGNGGGGADYSAEIRALENAVSVLATSAELSTEIGGTTTVALSELTAMDIDGRPSYKQAGATVYSENGVVGIIDTVDSTNAVITTVSTSASVEEGYTWTKVSLLQGESYNNQSLIVKLGNLPDGVYEFFIKNPNNCWGHDVFLLHIKIVNGEPDLDYNTSYYYPMVGLSKGTRRGFYADTDLMSFPTILGKVGDSIVYCSNIGYGDNVPGAITTGSAKLQYFEVSDIKNVDTGEFLLFESVNVYLQADWQQYVADNQLESQLDFRGVNPFYKYIDNYASLTCREVAPTIYPSTKFLGFGITNTKLDLEQIQTPRPSGYDSNTFPRGIILTVQNNEYTSERSDLLSVQAEFLPGAENCKILKATGVFEKIKSVKLYYDTYSVYDAVLFFEFEEIEIEEPISLAGSVSMYGAFYNNYVNAHTFDTVPAEQFVLFKTFPLYKIPSGTSSEYTIPHAGGLIEMGGIVPITDTLQPDVALGNVPVEFPNELANANFVPTITVMTDGTFKRVMADVANPTTTGFDLCVRNVDIEAVSGIKIAWKVVGTNK